MTRAFTVAIIGRPNVGKSTLFNRLVGGQPALVDDMPGVTRDRHFGTVEFGGRRFLLVDTGGLDPDAKSGLPARVRDQVRVAIDEADLLLAVVDARAGLTPLDHDAVAWARRSGRPMLVVANKVDGAGQEALIGEVHALGLDVVGVSAAHGRNVRELLDAVHERMPPEPEGEPEPEPGVVKLALVGRPNAGKSSLLNRLLGRERSLVDAEPGTTRDPVDAELVHRGARFLLVDTAGIRRKRSVERLAERQSVVRALRAVERCDVCALLIDAVGGVAEQDAKIAALAAERGRALVLVFNKWDLVEDRERGKRRGLDAAADKLRAQVAEQLPFVAYAPSLFVSAQTGRHVDRVLEQALAAASQWRRRVGTAELNRFLEDALARNVPPSPGGRSVRIYYVTQPAVAPPTFLMHANRPEDIPESYRRYLANRLREAFGFEGTPLRLIFRPHRARRGAKE